MNIVYMGTPDFAVPTLNKLIAAGHKIQLVVTQPDRRGNRGKVVFSPVKQCALEHNIKIAQPYRIKNDYNFIEELKQLKPDLIVVAAFGQILPQAVLDIPDYGCINVHGSMLPEYRGAAPMQYAILDGKSKTGVTIMRMDAGLDTGDIVSKAEIDIRDKDILDVSNELAEIGGDLAIKTIEDIVKGDANYTKQDDSLSSYAHMISKEDGYTDFNESAEHIYNKIRAFKIWPGTYTHYEGKILKIFDALFIDADEMMIENDESSTDYGTIINIDRDYIIVKCGKGLLKILEVQLQGKKRMMVTDFLRGCHLKIGDKFGN